MIILVFIVILLLSVSTAAWISQLDLKYTLRTYNSPSKEHEELYMGRTFLFYFLFFAGGFIIARRVYETRKLFLISEDGLKSYTIFYSEGVEDKPFELCTNGFCRTYNFSTLQQVVETLSSESDKDNLFRGISLLITYRRENFNENGVLKNHVLTNSNIKF